MSLKGTIELKVRNIKVGFHFYFDCNMKQAEAKINRLKTYFSRMPDEHLETVNGTAYLLVNALPGGRKRGGGYFRRNSAWLDKEKRTGISNDEINNAYSKRHIVGITKVAYKKNIFHFTVMHETAHIVDRYHDLYAKGTTVKDFEGQKYHSNSVGEYAAEAYSRYLIKPWAICRREKIPETETMKSCNQRTMRIFRHAGWLD